MTAETSYLRNELLQALMARFGLTCGSYLVNMVTHAYAGLLAKPSPFVDPRETDFAANEVLPLLALYQTLRTHGATFEDAEIEVRRIGAWALRARPVRGLRMAAWLPARNPWLRYIVRREAEAAFPEPAFSLKTIASPDGGVTFEVRRCVYAMALVVYGSPELLPVFCRLDEIRFERMANAITCTHTMPTLDSPQCRFCIELRRDTAKLDVAVEEI